MNTYVISDIHGHNKTFQKLLKEIDFSKTDTLYLLGDLIDRGPESKEVLDTVIAMQSEGYSIICLLGNHERMMLNALQDFQWEMSWVQQGGKETLFSFLAPSVDKIPNEYIDFIKTFEYYIESNNFILVHAGLDMTTDNPFADTEAMLWLRKWEEKFNIGWLGDRTVIHGHSPVRTEEIESALEQNAKVVCIDNGCFVTSEGYGKLGALHLESRKFITVNRV